MWIFSKVGFFSVVRNNQEDGVLVRARVRADLVALKKHYAPDLSAITHDVGRDYPYRAKLSHDELAKTMARVALDVDYSNFKSEVARTQGWDRERVYASVWQIMYDLENKLERARSHPAMLTEFEYLGEEPSGERNEPKPKKKGKKT